MSGLPNAGEAIRWQEEHPPPLILAYVHKLVFPQFREFGLADREYDVAKCNGAKTARARKVCEDTTDQSSMAFSYARGNSQPTTEAENNKPGNDTKARVRRSPNIGGDSKRNSTDVKLTKNLHELLRLKAPSHISVCGFDQSQQGRGIDLTFGLELHMAHELASAFQQVLRVDNLCAAKEPDIDASSEGIDIGECRIAYARGRVAIVQ
jgi:hypothetical protein